MQLSAKALDIIPSKKEKQKEERREKEKERKFKIVFWYTVDEKCINLTEPT